MKKIILIAAAVLGFALAASAQPRAIGGRVGYGLEASYQHTIGGADFVEVNAGLFGYDSFGAAATYNFMIAQPEWTSKGEWGFYAGPGASLNYGWGINENYDIDYETGEFNNLVTSSFNVAVMAQVGLEYTFWFPLQLSVDIRPMVGISVADGVSFYRNGLLGFSPCISARYRF